MGFRTFRVFKGVERPVAEAPSRKHDLSFFF